MTDFSTLVDLTFSKSTKNPCATGLSYSQISLCHYTLQMVEYLFELNFVHPRYFLGGDRPSQTTHQVLFHIWFFDSCGI